MRVECAFADFRACFGQKTDGILPTQLYCTNRDVDQENTGRLRSLKGEGVVFTANDTFKSANRDVQKQLDDTLSKKIPGKLELKVGAQVVLLRNLSDQLANGSRGVVVSIGSFPAGGPVLPTVRFDCGVSSKFASNPAGACDLWLCSDKGGDYSYRGARAV